MIIKCTERQRGLRGLRGMRGLRGQGQADININIENDLGVATSRQAETIFVIYFFIF